MRTVTNYFLVNLSVADLMMSSLNCGFNFIFLVNSDWPFGVVYCTINNFVAHVTVASSVFTLVVISFDRSVFMEKLSYIYVCLYCSMSRRGPSGKFERSITRRPFELILFIYSFHSFAAHSRSTIDNLHGSRFSL